MTIGREEVENPAGQNAEKPRKSKNKCSSAWKGFEASHMHSVHFPHAGTKSATPRNPPDRGKTSTASRCLAPVNSQEQDLDRHASLPSRSSVDRQDGADGCAVSDTGPVKTAAHQVETDPGVESQGRSQAQLALQRSADFPWLGKETNRKRTGEWNGKDLPAMCDKMFPPKPCHPARFVLSARDDVLSGPMTYWQMPHFVGICKVGEANVLSKKNK